MAGPTSTVEALVKIGADLEARGDRHSSSGGCYERSVLFVSVIEFIFVCK